MSLSKDKEIAKKIAVSYDYFMRHMTADERAFARVYPRKIRWINRFKIGKNDRAMATNDFWQGRVEFELKTPRRLRYRAIASAIRESVKKHPFKQNYLIYLKNRSLSGKLLQQLRRYNINNPDHQITRLVVFGNGVIIKVKLQTKN